MIVFVLFCYPLSLLQISCRSILEFYCEFRYSVGKFSFENQHQFFFLDTEVYVKTCLIIDEEKIKRRSISQSLQRATNATVVWNESLSYPVKYSQLEQCVLLLYVVEHRKETQKEKTVGKCVIGPFGGASSAGYLQWQQQGSSSVIRSNAMWHTVVRYSTNKKQPEEKSAS